MAEAVANYWQKAQEALQVAAWAYENGCYNETVSRSYFAVLKAALALLCSLGITPKETARIGYWMQANFARECIHRRKLMPAERARWLADLRNLRVRAEHTPELMTESRHDKP